MRHHRLLVWSVLMLMLLLSSAISAAQPDRVLTVAVLDSMEGEALNSAIADYETDNPAIQVQIVPVAPENLLNALSFDGDVEAYLESLADYAQSADVLYVGTDLFDATATRSGFFLDLAPLLQADTATGSALRPVAQESFAWDGTQWALPTVTSPVALLYDPAAFDAANLSYPNENWSLADFTNAARTLAVTDSAGNVTAPGVQIISTDEESLLLVDSSQTLTDGGLPAQADFSQVNSDAVETLQGLHEDGVVTDDFSQDAPMIIRDAGFLLARDTLTTAPLPGGYVGLTVEGFAVSAGTSQAQVAYDFAAHLTNYPDVSRLVAGVPARTDATRTAIFSDDVLDVSESLMPFARSVSDFQFAGYAAQSLSDLESAETRLNNDLMTIANQAETVEIVVSNPEVEAASEAAGVTIDFYAGSRASPNPMAETWRQVAAEFSESENITVNLVFDSGTDTYSSIRGEADRADCFYAPGVQFLNDPAEYVLPITPLVNSDPDYDSDDFIVDAESDLTRDGELYGMPLSIQPWVMGVDVDALEEAGLPVPDVDWTAQEFTSLVEALGEEQSPVIRLYRWRGQYQPLMMLTALYADPVIDTETGTSTTVNYDSEASQQALIRVLDWWKSGQLVMPSGLRAQDDISEMGNVTAPVAISEMGQNSLREGEFYPGRTSFASADTAYRPLPFPQGEYLPVSYTLSGAFISRNAENPEACYKFIRYIAERPEMFQLMPLRGSQLDDPALQATRGDDVLAFYRAYNEQLSGNNRIYNQRSDPSVQNAVLFFGWLSGFVELYLTENNVDVQAEFGRMQRLSEEFLQTCEFDPENPNAIWECASETIDPGLEFNFGW